MNDNLEVPIPSFLKSACLRVNHARFKFCPQARLVDFNVDVVDCGLTSHSAIFQLYSDGTDVQFPNFDLLPGTPAMGS